MNAPNPEQLKPRPAKGQAGNVNNSGIYQILVFQIFKESYGLQLDYRFVRHRTLVKKAAVDQTQTAQTCR